MSRCKGCEEGDARHLADLAEHEAWCRCEEPEGGGCPCGCEDCDPERRAWENDPRR